MNAALFTIVMALGWVGAFLYLASYYLVSTGKLAPDSLRYQAMCVSSGVMVIVMQVVSGAWPSAFSNIVFVGIGLFMVLGPQKRPHLIQLIARKSGRPTPTVPVAHDAQISFTEATASAVPETVAAA